MTHRHCSSSAFFLFFNDQFLQLDQKRIIATCVHEESVRFQWKLHKCKLSFSWILKCLSWNTAKKSLRWWAWSRFNQHSCRQNVEQIHKWNSRISSSLASPNLYERFLHVECRESRTYILCWFMRCFSSILWTNGRRRKERKTRKDDECFCEQRKTRWWLSRATQSAHTPWLFERSQSKV